MNAPQPPALAVWLLERFSGDGALIGDLVEEWRSGRSTAWFWSQALGSIVVRRWNAAASMAGLVALYAIGRHIAIPGVNSNALAALARDTSGSFRVYDILSGGNLGPVSVLALAINPYTTAATATQLVLWMRRFVLGRMTGPSARTVVRTTWALAILVAATQALGLTLFLERQSRVAGGLTLVVNPGWAFRIPTISMLTAATVCLMWISDRLSRTKTANGLLLVFLSGLLVGLPALRTASLGAVLQLAATTTIVTITSTAYRRDLVASAR